MQASIHTLSGQCSRVGRPIQPELATDGTRMGTDLADFPSVFHPCPIRGFLFPPLNWLGLQRLLPPRPIVRAGGAKSTIF
jgi:hypothetical protein